LRCRDDGRHLIAHADEKLTAFIELERQVLTVTFYLESINRGFRGANDLDCGMRVAANS
jgi:hypothetical protein